MSARSDPPCGLDYDRLETAIRDHSHVELVAVGRIIDVLEGEVEESLDGTKTRPEDGGVVGRVGKLEAGQVEILAAINNGIKLKLSKKQITAGLTGLVSAGAMLLNHLA